MAIASSRALVATRPVPWASKWGASQQAHRFRDEQRRRNGIVYVGLEATRTRQIYSSSGRPIKEPMALGQLIDIYV